jgi:hypothetical protein
MWKEFCDQCRVAKPDPCTCHWHFKIGCQQSKSKLWQSPEIREIFTIFLILSGASCPNMFGCDYLLYTKGYNIIYIYIIQKSIQKVIQKVWPVACLIFIKYTLTLKHHWQPISLCELCNVRRSSRMWGTEIEQTKLCTLPMSYN